MAIFRKPAINPDVKAYASYFGKGILIVAGLLLIGGLVLFSFFYGDRERRSAETTQTTGTANNQVNDAAAPEAAVTSPDSQVPTSAPSEVVSTGPEDFAWLGTTLSLLALSYWHRSRQTLRLVRGS